MATVTKAQWNKYISRLRKINDKAAAEFKEFILKKGGYEAIERDVLIDRAYWISTKYGEASAALTASMYDAIAELSGAAVPAALPAQTATYSEVAKTVNGIIKNTGNPNILSQGIGKLVKMAGTDTMLANAYRDRPRSRGRGKQRASGAQVAWVPDGDACPFCLMLAADGWRNQTIWAADNHSEHIHANCNCTYMVRFNDDLDVAGYDPEEYREIYENASDGGRDAKLNAMRRDYYEENKDHINEMKRLEYKQRKIREEEDEDD